VKVRHAGKSSDHPRPRVMGGQSQGWLLSVDRGLCRLGIELRNPPRGCRPCCLMGKAARGAALARAARRPSGVVDPAHAQMLFARNPGDPRTGHGPCYGPAEEGLWPHAPHVRPWEVGSDRSTEEAREQSGLSQLAGAGCSGVGGGKGLT